MKSWKTWLRFAFRNLMRNKRRSIVTLCAATLGYAAVNVFGGFTNYMFVNLRDAFIHAEGNGQIQVFRKGYHERGSTDPGEYLLSAETVEKLHEIADQDDRILFISGKLSLTGQIDTGHTSNIFIGSAMRPSARKEFYERATTLKSGDSFVAKGEPLTDDNPYQVGIAFGVRDTLGIDVGSDVVLMGRTVDGQINVVDATVKNVFGVSNSFLSNRYVAMPLELAQELYQTDGVGSAAILLRHDYDVPGVLKTLREGLGPLASNLEFTVWDEASETYVLTRRMFDMIFGFVFLILIVIVTMSVMNTMGMAIIERITEIGTLRALGLKRFGIVGLFGIEGSLLGVLGSLLGLIVTLAVSLTIRVSEPQWTPPILGRPVPLEIRVVPSYLIITFIFLSVLTFVAAILPARRAAQSSIVDALGHT